MEKNDNKQVQGERQKQNKEKGKTIKKRSEDISMVCAIHLTE